MVELRLQGGVEGPDLCGTGTNPVSGKHATKDEVERIEHRPGNKRKFLLPLVWFLRLENNRWVIPAW